MTEEEIKALYSKIEGLDTNDIKALVNAEIPSIGGVAQIGGIGCIAGTALMGGMSTLEKACKKAWEQNKKHIQSIIQNNPKSSKTIMDVICLLAPTIAQQYTGFSGMAIVGTLTIMCKQNLGL